MAALTLGAAPSCCVPTRNTVTPSSDSLTMYISTVQSSPSSASAALPLHPRLQTSYFLSTHSVSSPSSPSPLPLARGCPSTSPDSLRVLQWNAGGLRARSTELLHFVSFHPVDLICIQESNLNSSSSFQIPEFSALCSDHTHARSGIFSPDPMHASGVSSFLSGRAYPFLNSLPSFFRCSIPTLIM